MRATTAVVGREHELGVISEFLADGPSPTAALVLEGTAGIGKTTLWQRAAELAQESGYRVLSSRPAEPDSGLSFAGVGDLLAGVIDGVLARLSGAQRSALEVALLLTDSVAPVPDQGALAFGFPERTASGCARRRDRDRDRRRAVARCAFGPSRPVRGASVACRARAVPARHPERRSGSGAGGARTSAAGTAPDAHRGSAQPGGAVRAASHGAWAAA